MMRSAEEFSNEVKRRGEKYLLQRRKNRNRLIVTCTPVVLCLIVGTIILTSGYKEYSENSDTGYEKENYVNENDSYITDYSEDEIINKEFQSETGMTESEKSDLNINSIQEEDSFLTGSYDKQEYSCEIIRVSENENTFHSFFYDSEQVNKILELMEKMISSSTDFAEKKLQRYNKADDYYILVFTQPSEENKTYYLYGNYLMVVFDNSETGIVYETEYDVIKEFTDFVSAFIDNY
ncbi:MAG: hypothetical protein ACI39R_08075 [Lachnospiraceae bacterium]